MEPESFETMAAPSRTTTAATSRMALTFCSFLTAFLALLTEFFAEAINGERGAGLLNVWARCW